MNLMLTVLFRAFIDHVSVNQEFMDTSGGGVHGLGTPGGIPARRKSRKKTVDRRASKGRKIKYVTHPKMQNFMFPQVKVPGNTHKRAHSIVSDTPTLRTLRFTSCRFLATFLYFFLLFFFFCFFCFFSSFLSFFLGNRATVPHHLSFVT